jgi:hypothetical protein
LRHGHVANLGVGGQEGLDGHRVGGLAHADDVAADLIDLAVQRFLEMFRLEEIGHAIERVIVDQHCAQKRLFGLDVGRRLAKQRAFLSPGRDRFYLSCGVIHLLDDPELGAGGGLQ